MRRTIGNALAMAGMAVACAAHAGGISDVGVDPNSYWGSDDHDKHDVIGDSVYDIQGATITRIGTVLTIAIATSFAGHAGMDAAVNPGGIGYGDVFLADTWNPFGTDSHHINDNAANGTVWDYGFSLDNRFSNTGGKFTLYQLNGATNAANILNSNNVMSCTLGSQCLYREGQATEVKTSSSSVKNTGLSGNWSVTADQQLKFTIDLATSDLLNFGSFAMHWGETCQNDVIEGQTRVVPLPGSLPLLALGLGALLVVRRRQA